MDAVQYQKLNCLTFLLEAGADVNKTCDEGKGALHYAAYNADSKYTELLLNAGAYVNIVDSGSNTALTIASKFGHHHSVELLIKAGADVNYVCRYGYTALLLASQRGHPKSVEMLITAGTDVNSKSELNCTALFTGAQGVEMYTCVKVLLGANILINEVSDLMLLNVLGHVLRTCHHKDINYHAAKLLYAAGETLAYVR